MSQASAEAIRLYAAGSLKAAMTDIARAFEARSSGRYVVETEFGASGLLRERIEKGEKAHVFASANMKHPQTLAAAGKAEGAVRMFARNQLCALAREGVAATSDTLLATMLSDHVRVGTSTPKADPSGDYAFRLFAKAEAVTPGAKARLESKALKLTGGADTAKAPEGRNQYGWVMSEAKADVFLTYCTNAVLAKKDTPSLQIIDVPATLAVGADYGMVVLAGGPDAAKDLAAFILGGEAQSIMRQYGFGAGSDVTK
ncbi:MAG: molybdate ABC transporter substrate-binding protein [Hyphomicrobiaceae bacterium]|nr:molybdate ABC transporter substrate-binding protein [Hyphomicrobiaceae bacterium]